MSDSVIIDNKPKFFCDTCNYGTEFNNVYKKHLNSEKHIRHGEKKIFKCNSCDYKTNTSHWNLKMHITSKHSTIEEKSKQKYYCVICDSVFFSPLFYKNHIKSILHINKTILNNSLTNKNDTNEINIIDVSNNNLDITINNDLKTDIKAELKNELKGELKREIMLEIRKKLLELFV